MNLNIDSLIESLKKHGVLGAVVIYSTMSTFYLKNEVDDMKARLQTCYENKIFSEKSNNSLSLLNPEMTYAVIPKDPIGKIERL